MSQTLKTCTLSDEYKHVCFKDLEGYLSTDNLVDELSNLTDSEAALIKAALGIKDNISVDTALNMNSTNPVLNRVLFDVLSHKANIDRLSKVAVTGNYHDLKHIPCALPNPEALIVRLGDVSRNLDPILYDGCEPVVVTIPKSITDLVDWLNYVVDYSKIEDMIPIKIISVNGDDIIPDENKRVNLEIALSRTNVDDWIAEYYSLYILPLITEISNRVDDLSSRIETYESRFTGIDNRIDNAEDSISSIENTLSSTTNLITEKFSQVRDQINDLNSKFLWLVGNICDLVGNCGGLDPTVVSILLSPKNQTITIGETLDYIVNKIWSDGTIEDITSETTLTSSDTSIATMSSNVATGIAVGTTTITAVYTYEDVEYTDSTELTVENFNSFTLTNNSGGSLTEGTFGNFNFAETPLQVGESAVMTSSTLTKFSYFNLVGEVEGTTYSGLSALNVTIPANGGSANSTVTFTKNIITLSSTDGVIYANEEEEIISESSTTNASWSIEDTEVSLSNGNTAAISVNGSIITVTVPSTSSTEEGTGTLTITGENGFITTITITQFAEEVTLTSIELTPETATINLGETQSYVVTANWSNGTTSDVSNSSTLTSSDTSVANISSGTVFNGLAVGLVDITASYESKTDTATLKVESPYTCVESITLSPNSLTLVEEYTSLITATVTPSDYEGLTLTWSSSNESVATVDQNGLVTAIGEGTCTISYTANNLGNCEEVSASINVTVEAPYLYIGDSENPLSVEEGKYSIIKYTISADGQSITAVEVDEEEGNPTSLSSGILTVNVATNESDWNIS